MPSCGASRDVDETERAGLCASCRCADTIASSKGSIFYRCRRSETDPSFRRYPVLPMIACRGYERRETGA